jgi:hypothetical protein
LNGQIKQLLEASKVNIPENLKLMFLIDPNTYRLSVGGTNDTDLASRIEDILNLANNTKALFGHIIRSCSDDSN